jgi:histidinol dehydrogenase
MLNNIGITQKENSDLLMFRDLVITNGDQGINEINRNLGLPELKKFKVSSLDIKKSELQVDDDLKSAILISRANISKIHQDQRLRLDSKQIETTKGITVWSEFRPIEKVGLYIPGGTAPLFSALLMQAIPALIAGCKDIVICTPPNEAGKVDPTLLWIAKLLKITNIYKVGGSQAIFAMTYGTKSIPKVDKLFGPGNKFVTRAKQLVSDVVAIDMPAGPSEVFVASNNINNSELIAADLLSQLEHGKDSKAVMN